MRPQAREELMQNLWKALWSDDSGQGMVEYALIIALIAIGLIAILVFMRNRTGDVYQAVSDSLQNAPSNPYVPN
jgi:pilus assembly protein Flp/PilA